MSAKRIDWERIKRALAKAEQNLAAALVIDESRKKPLLQKRAEYLAARRSAPGVARKTSPAMGFMLGKERYAIDLASLRRVVTTEGLVPIPGAREHLLGVMNMSGEVGSVWDLAGLLELPKQEAGPGGQVLVLKAGFAVGLRVDYVEGRQEIDAGALISPHDVEDVLPVKYLKGMTQDKILLLDAEVILAEEFLGQTAGDKEDK